MGCSCEPLVVPRHTLRIPGGAQLAQKPPIPPSLSPGILLPQSLLPLALAPLQLGYIQPGSSISLCKPVLQVGELKMGHFQQLSGDGNPRIILHLSVPPTAFAACMCGSAPQMWI